ncbi:ATP synthase subunit C lysine N-methyltransferase-like [Pelobates fuscus]|uniref:ATP synthase subunit C lysine N-methyltransferase-like n=1 Tax=Pelobates fuscus TaxID=191477 RepID=UPI002FE444FB
MEDNIDTILLNKTTKFLFNDTSNYRLPWIASGMTVSSYALWAIFVLPGFRKVPWKLKVPFLPSSKHQTANVVKLLNGRKGRLVDLGSGDGRLVFAAVSIGFQSRGYELNPILVTWAKTQARWRGISEMNASFVKENFWTADLSSYNNVVLFLAPSVMESLEQKLYAELSDDAWVIACRFPFPHWKPTGTEGTGLDQVWAYSMKTIRNGFTKPQPS